MSTMRVTVLINNYNYARFVTEAVRSAQTQTRPIDEIVVVDDGSTDESVALISALAAKDDRIVLVTKPNGGQASAFNVGFERSSGDILILLDADDRLEPFAAERIAAAFEARPDAAKVHYQMNVIDAQGRPTGDKLPLQPLSSGDLRAHVLANYQHEWPPTSSMSFPRWALARILPVPEDPFYISADLYLTDVAVLLGPFLALDERCACYRLHGNNGFHASAFLKNNKPDVERAAHRVRGHLMRCRASRSRQRELARELGLNVPPVDRAIGRRTGLQRLISLKLDPQAHPIVEDTVSRAAFDAARAWSSRRHNPRANAVERVIQVMWIGAVAFAPHGVARALIWEYYFPSQRRALTRTVARNRAKRLQFTSDAAAAQRPATIGPIKDVVRTVTCFYGLRRHASGPSVPHTRNSKWGTEADEPRP
jgi:glycosyltransferase involved in cell wall biosynthesis